MSLFRKIDFSGPDDYNQPAHTRQPVLASLHIRTKQRRAVAFRNSDPGMSHGPPPSPSTQARSKAAIAGRLRLIRSDLFGEQGGRELARQLGIPSRTWLNYESGVTIPGDVLLRFLVISNAEPLWLLDGEGPQYRAREPRTVAARNPWGPGASPEVGALAAKARPCCEMLERSRSR